MTDAYRESAKTPALVINWLISYILININYKVSAFIDSSSSSLVSLVSRWSQSNLSTNSKVSFTKLSTLTGDSLSLVHESVGVAETGVEMVTVKDDTTVKVTES